jgi:prolyl-tRNA synthetase
VPHLILLRGDHTLNELKFRAMLGIGEARPATPDEIRKWFGADPGSLGPVAGPSGIDHHADRRR